MAGGGSLLTIPLLTVYADLGGLVANGTNRVGVLSQSLSATISFRREGVSGLQQALPAFIPVLIGSVIGASAVSRLSEQAYEVSFGVLMVPLVLLTFRRPKATGTQIVWPTYVTVLVFFGIGLYGGAFQAGVGLVIVLALSHAGLALTNANAVKVTVAVVLSAAAIPVFIFSDQVHWGYALLVAGGFGLGGWIGARLAVRGGERLIRPVMLVAVVALAGRMVGLY